MTQEELAAFKKKLTALVERGTEAEVREYVDHYYSRLPEDVRQELLFHTLLGALKEEAQEEAVLTQVQEEGLAAAEALEKAREEAEKDGLT